MVRLTEFPNHVGLCGIWCPFPIGDVVLLVNVQPELLRTLDPYSQSAIKHRGKARNGTYPRESLYPALGLVDLLDPVLSLRESVLEAVLEWLQPWVELDHAWLLCQFTCLSGEEGRERPYQCHRWGLPKLLWQNHWVPGCLPKLLRGLPF
jgi:hypothetical protein